MRRWAWMGLVLVVVSLAGAAESTAAKPANGKAAADQAAVAAPAHPVTPEQVWEILDLTRAVDVKQQMLDGLLPHVKTMLPYMPQSVLDDIQRSMAIADFDGAVIRAYQRRISTEEAAEIIAFLRTPAGRKMASVLPQVQDEGEQAGAELGQQVMLEVIQRHQAEIEAAKKRYQQEQGAGSPQS
ncbi:MAG TPA: DUF2059 domain-containing protein [Acidobacteriaceae bacterium]|nr:DUF2059 domain-containing protein [Acidobacteriaceae bacterium]